MEDVKAMEAVFFQRFDEGCIIQVVYSNPCTNRHLLAAEEQRMAESSAICNAHGQRLHANNGRAFE